MKTITIYPQGKIIIEDDHSVTMEISENDVLACFDDFDIANHYNTESDLNELLDAIGHESVAKWLEAQNYEVKDLGEIE